MWLKWMQQLRLQILYPEELPMGFEKLLGPIEAIYLADEPL